MREATFTYTWNNCHEIRLVLAFTKCGLTYWVVNIAREFKKKIESTKKADPILEMPRLGVFCD